MLLTPDLRLLDDLDEDRIRELEATGTIPRE
jgi:hypothetical protein